MNTEPPFKESSISDFFSGRPDPVNPPKTTAKPAPKIPADKPIDAPMTQAELRKQLANAFNAIPSVLTLPHVEASDVPMGDGQLRFEQDEFDSAAEALITLFGQHAQLRVIMRLVGPLASVSVLIEKVQRIVRAFQLKRVLREQAKRDAEQARLQPNLNLDGGNNADNEFTKRGLFR